MTSNHLSFPERGMGIESSPITVFLDFNAPEAIFQTGVEIFFGTSFNRFSPAPLPLEIPKNFFVPGFIYRIPPSLSQIIKNANLDSKSFNRCSSGNSTDFISCDVNRYYMVKIFATGGKKEEILQNIQDEMNGTIDIKIS